MWRRSLSFSIAVAALPMAEPARGAATLPAWLEPGPSTVARVDVAAWSTPDEPEAALTQTPASVERDGGADAGRPGDVVYQPVGVRVRLLRVLSGGRVALVHGIGSHWQAYAPLDRLVPEVPRGTALAVAGGFGGSADLFAVLASPALAPLQLATGTHLIALETGVAPYDPGNSDLVRLHVRLTSGSLRGRAGWIAVAFTGLPMKHVAAWAGIVARACSCRIVQFRGSRP